MVLTGGCVTACILGEFEAEGGFEDLGFGEGFDPFGFGIGVGDDACAGAVGEGGGFEGVGGVWGGGALDVEGSDVDGGVECSVWGEGEC